ncbi:MAG TPA: glycosyltransferase family 4 protein, partial [Steroidobacteraceae bacterium]|nr:glycosyltransferase family 4 protein [Steroidobacteraceae bacterium]
TFSKAIIRFVLRRAALVLALSDHWRTELTRISPRATVRTLPNAVRLQDPPPPVTSLTPLRVLFAGRIGPRKGTFELLEAFARVAPKFPGAILVCAGDGASDELLALAAKRGIADRVTCPGWLGAAEMASELSRASVFALPSHAEGVPMALLEAMSRGIAVLTTPVGGIPEVVQNEHNGLLVQPGDVDAIERALLTLLGSSGERARLGEAARNTIAARYSLTAAIEELSSIYRRFGLVDRGAPP